MKKKIYCALAMALITLLMLASAPAWAAEVGISVNGDTLSSIEMYVENGISMVPAKAFARLSGAALKWEADTTLLLSKGGLNLKLALNNKEAMLGAKSVVLPCPPCQQGGEVYLPLRSVSVLFGYEVSWDSANSVVVLTQAASETRAGMSPAELLAKSNQATLDINTYAIDGQMNITTEVTADGKKVQDAPAQMTTELTGIYQNKPMQVYIKQILKPVGDVAIPETVVETYMTQEKLYLKAPGQEWTVQNMPFSAEFWKEQQDIQSDPLKAMSQMQDMGIILNFGDDAAIDGNQYYVVNAFLDMDKFKEKYQELMQQAIQGMSQGAAGSDGEAVQQQMQKFMDSAVFDYYYTVYINKETWMCERVKFEADIKFSMKSSDFGQDEQVQAMLPEEIDMAMSMEGEFTIGNWGMPFTAPDVSKAVEMPALLPQEQ